MPDEITYAARWVFPVDGPPLEGGSVTVRGDRIAAVQPAGARRPDVALGDVALLPGFVNAHTHLDLSGAHGRCPPTPDFTAWLRQVIAFRRQRTPEQVQQDIAAGIAACLLSGTTLVGDISTGGASWDLLARSPLRATVYYELIGLTKERAERSWHEAQRWLEAHPATATCQPGISPHAPYSVRRELFQAVARFAKPREFPVAIHLAETAEEMELLQHRSGPFVDFLRELGIWTPEALVSGWAEITKIFWMCPGTNFIHGNYLDFENWSEISNQPVVVCPRTSHSFGRNLDLLRRRACIHSLGTDSLASNPDLNILSEARCLYKDMHPKPPTPWRIYANPHLLSSITLHGAWALRWGEETGSLASGKSADMVVLPLPARDAADPHDLIFDSDLPVRAVMFRGAWVVGSGAA